MRVSIASLVLLTALLAACDNSSNTPPPVNQAPTVAAIAATSTTANGASQPISFEVSDENPATLQLTATSDNPLLVTDDAIVIGGSDGSRTLTITPTTDMTGDAQISVVAVDAGGLMDGASFLLTVTAEQKSMQQFTRDSFADDADDDPPLINAVEFAQDADEDDFADLLAD